MYVGSLTIYTQKLLQLKGIKLGHNIFLKDLHRNVEITIFRNVANTFSFGTLSEEDLRERLNETILYSAKKLLDGMEELLKKVRIWHKQCQHLLDKYWKVVKWMRQALNFLKKYSHSRVKAHSVKFICSKVICCMLEGQELLLLCGGNDYDKAAFELSSPKSTSAPTFSRFSLVLRELDWTMDFICFFGGEIVSLDSWDWCKKSCRLKYGNGNFWMRAADVGEENLEADGHREANDREALRETLNSKLIRSPSSSNASVVSPLNFTVISSFFHNLLVVESHRKPIKPNLKAYGGRDCLQPPTFQGLAWFQMIGSLLTNQNLKL